MKKYKIMYIVIFVLLLAILLTNGIRAGIVIDSTFQQKNIPGIVYINAEGYTTYKLMIYNCAILLGIFFISLIITLKKDNKFKYKIPVFIFIIILLIFEPILMTMNFYAFGSINEEIIYNNIVDIINVIIF